MHINKRTASRKRTKEQKNEEQTSTSPYQNVKIQRAFGGCLGVKGRRKAWYTAKSLGEPCAGEEPRVPEWGNPVGVKAQSLYGEYISIQGERGELKHLSTRRKREYSLSSGERKGSSPNRPCGTGCGRCTEGVEGIDR